MFSLIFLNKLCAIECDVLRRRVSVFWNEMCYEGKHKQKLKVKILPCLPKKMTSARIKSEKSCIFFVDGMNSFVTRRETHFKTVNVNRVKD